MRSRLLFATATVLGVNGPFHSNAWAGPEGHDDGTVPAGASQDAVNAINSFKFDPSLKIQLIAAEPLLRNPVAFSPDEHGRWFISETYRQERGVEDNRGHIDWLNDDIAARTLDDRLATMRKFYSDPKKFAEKFEKEEERIVVLEDTNADGAMDKSTIFADGFRDPLDGTAAGILARGKEVWWTNIPNFWRFEDRDGDGRADTKDKALTGFGVKFALRGHDLHGLRFGPDGKLYFSIGDRGINVTSKEGRKFEYPDTGCVMRCNPDGSAFEVYATGLRNPQELAFNEFGDLFTGDNNSDSSDLARFLQIVEGGEYGWRMTFQYLNDRGPWNREKWWDEQIGLSARSLIPPIANLADGPSGLTYNPGTGLSEKHRGKFFLSDFRGGPGSSVVHEIEVQPKGAGYGLKERRDFVRGILSTDCEFGPDGGFYVLDWVESWSGVKKGRIYKFTDPAANVALLAETQKIIGEGMTGRPEPELARLLAHADQRVRQAAQFELAARSGVSVNEFSRVATDPKSGTLARLHAIWGLGQMAEKTPPAAAPLVGLLTDADAEVRAQAAKVLGERKIAAAADPLVSLLKDSSPRVAFQTALALGKIGHAPAVGALLQALAENRDQDPILRHGLVMGLVGCATAEQLAAKASDGSVAVRIGAVVALRRQRSPLIADFLHDADEAVVLEAARGIHDAPINAALPALAGMLENRARINNPRIVERVVNASYRLGGADRARALAAFATDTDVPEESRREALNALAEWPNPSPKDRLLNLWRPLPPRGGEAAVAAIGANLPGLLHDPSGGIQETAAKLAAKLSITSAGASLAELVMNDRAAIGSRIAALQGLQTLKDHHLAKSAKCAMNASDPKLRAEGLKALAAADAASAVKQIGDIIERGSPREKQGAVLALAQIDKPEAKAVIAGLMDKLLAGQCVPEIQLDVYAAAKALGLDEQTQKFRAMMASRSAADPLATYRVTLVGGDTTRGRKIFREKAEVSCIRCHKCEIGESSVGPDLTHIGAQRDRLSILESIVYPNRKIAPGFEIVSLVLKDKQVVAGKLVGEDAGNLRIESFDEHGQPKVVTVSVENIQERTHVLSAMPDNLKDHLNRGEIRDLVEFLATRQ
jgi:quinoprotein glucose dehydrogenase